MASLPGCFLFQISRGLLGPGHLAQFATTTCETICSDPSLFRFISEEMATAVHEAMAYLIEQGGYPLRAFWVMTAVLIPQIWHAQGVSDPSLPYPVLRRQTDAFIFVKRGFETPERYLFSVQRLFDIQQVRPIPIVMTMKAAPRIPLQARTKPKAIAKEPEHRIKTDNHTQLHLCEAEGGTFEEQMETTSQVSEMIKHRDYIQAILCVLFRCYLFSFNEANRKFPV